MVAVPWSRLVRDTQVCNPRGVAGAATTVTRMEKGLDQVTRLKRELAQQGAQLRELQLLLLRVSGVAAIVLMAIGLVLPAWSEELDDKHVTARVLTTGFVAIWGEQEQ